MRQLALAVLFLSAPAAFASDLYIVPAFANRVSNGRMEWRSEVFLTNPHAHGVDVELGTTIGVLDPDGCRFPEFSLPFPEHLAPRETRRICMAFDTSGAFAFETSDTLIVTSEMIAFRRLGEASLLTRQPVEPGRRWIEHGEPALIPNVRIRSDIRANLILVNPGQEAITVHYRVVRVSNSPPFNHDYQPVEGDVEVPARSLTIMQLPEGPEYDCMGLVPCGNSVEHEVILESSGRFYAATSSVENDLDATFRSPYVLLP